MTPPIHVIVDYFIIETYSVFPSSFFAVATLCTECTENDMVEHTTLTF